jgi:hypothetical protein
MNNAFRKTGCGRTGTSHGCQRAAPGDAVGPHRRDVADGIGRVGDVMLRQPGVEDFFGIEELPVGRRRNVPIHDDAP